MKVYALSLTLLFSILLPAHAREMVTETFRYNRLPSDEKTALANVFSLRARNQKRFDIPKQFTVPAELIFYRQQSKKFCYAIKNKNYPFSVGMIPSDLVSYYEQEAWRARQQHGEDAPALSVVLALHYTESAFNPNIKGDHGNSIGLGQLYKPTARILLKQNNELWSDYFYFDKKGNHHFRNTQKMIRFTFDFLPLVKNYAKGQKFDGVRAYNGIGEHAEHYAHKVITRSLVYERFFSKYHQYTINTQQYKVNLRNLLSNYLYHKYQVELPADQFENLFNECVDLVAAEGIFPLQKATDQHIALEKKINATNMHAHQFSVEEQKTHLLIEDGQVVFDYFRDTKLMLSVLNQQENGGYYCYDRIKGEKKIIFDVNDLEDETFYSNIIPGDFVYLPKGTMVFTPKENATVLIR
ncbi:hypothetical protein PEPS_12230 [Persicobacter psychrovividus]|uniref:Transglycosylase SLT domain-containing protein n=2 Tax=Persicobacter psychrovividus TaxID=387638 RepID=A0ABN6L6W2_9BACT|nr:hypothetical protein PEPS_12230 [Persicobacter psychrovividus]